MPVQLQRFSLLLASLLAGAQVQAQGVKTPAGSIPWSANRPLTVADFQSRPQPNETHAALTSTDIHTGASCHGNAFAGTARASFDPTRSWVREPAAITPKLLRHEQLHFDIAEVYARRLRQQLAGVRTPCNKLGNTFNQLTEAGYAAWQQANDDYDRDTNHGLQAGEQARWEALVRQQLVELAGFAEEEASSVSGL
ncbi:MAG: DUF922 domain-containing protein [Janthinobacterium lividum]